MLKVLHARNANFFGKFFQERFFLHFLQHPFSTYLDTCKARTANRKIMSKKKKRVDTIVDILGKKGIQVSQQNLDTGIFPWHDTKQCLILYDVHFLKSINYYNCSLQCLQEKTMTSSTLGFFRSVIVMPSSKLKKKWGNSSGHSSRYAKILRTILQTTLVNFLMM